MPKLIKRFTRSLGNAIHDGFWRTPDEARMSASERAFIEERAEGHDADMLIRATFGGGDPMRLLDFPDDRPPR